MHAYIRREHDGACRAFGAEILLYWSGAVEQLSDTYRRFGDTLEALETGDATERQRAVERLEALVA